MTVRVLNPVRNVMNVLVVLAMLLGMVVTFASPVTAESGIVRGDHWPDANGGVTDKITLGSPSVTEADVAAGAVLIAQLVATYETDVSDFWICPLESGWTQVERVGLSSKVVQHIWWREVTAPQMRDSTNYTFQVRQGGCGSQVSVAASIAGGITSYSGVDRDDPIGSVSSTASTTNGQSATAPSTGTNHSIGSGVVRYFGTNSNKSIGPDDSTRVYSQSVAFLSRSAAAFDTVLTSEGQVGTFTATWERNAAWVATTVVLEEPSAAGPIDTTPPQTTADSAPYTPGAWTDVPISISLSATDTDGSGVKEIVYSASGAQAIDPTTVSGASANVSVSAEGTTTVTYAARDVAGNFEPEQTLVVQIDKTSPTLTGQPTTTPNEHTWFANDVTIDWACSDALSGIDGGCPADSVISGEGSGLSVSATVHDTAGNLTTASVSGINIDRTAPLTTIAPVPEWSDGPVTVSFSASDNLSGVLDTRFVVDQGTEQSGDEVTFTESGVHTLRFWSVDVAGNEETATEIEVKIDSIAPSISHTLSSESNEDGWHRTPVTVSFICADGPSGIASCTEPQTLATDGVSQTVTGTAVDVAGNSATDTAIINIDQTLPEINASRTPPANDSGWNNTSVVVEFTCDDATSGISVCPLAETVGEGSNQSVRGVATDLAGNSASATVDGINVDLTPPQISATATTTDGRAYVPGAWVNQPVTVVFTCSDALSDVATCPAHQIITEGTNPSVTGTAYDNAGNSASVTVGPINVDTTAPTIAASLTMADGQPYTPGSWARQSVTVTFDCQDGLSTVASCSASQTLGDGTGQVVIGTVSDAAGNSASTTVSGINVDMVGPEIVATAETSDGLSYVSGAWTNQTVTVSFSCVDDVSGLEGPCPLPVVVSASTLAVGQEISAQISDRAGHVAVSAVILVLVDKDAPVFTSVPGDQVIEATSDDGAEVIWTPPAAFDAVAGAITPSCSASSGSTFPLGDTVVTCTATDPAGNVATAAFTIAVRDTQPPELVVPESMTVLADSPAGAVVNYDLASGQSRVANVPDCTPVSGSRFKVGTTIVSCSATDGSGNIATGSFTITVIGAVDLLKTLRGDTMTLVVDRNYEQALLRSLDQAEQAMTAGNPLRAYMSMLQYRVRVALYTRYGRITPAANAQLQAGAGQVVNALW